MAVTIQDDMFEAARLYEDGAGLIYALVEYAETGAEPEASNAWYPTFVAFKSRIRMSAEAHANGRKGGRPRKVRETPSEEPLETVPDNPLETQPGEGLETPFEEPFGTENKERGVENRDREVEKEIDDVLAHLNTVCGTRFSLKGEHSRSLVRARLHDYSAEELKRAVSNMASHWKGNPDMERYLRPETLFRASKFDGYLNTKPKQEEFGKYSGLKVVDL